MGDRLIGASICLMLYTSEGRVPSRAPVSEKLRVHKGMVHDHMYVGEYNKFRPTGCIYYMRKFEVKFIHYIVIFYRSSNIPAI
jgi:hypothetical protein